MSNPFKVGDKVRTNLRTNLSAYPDVYTVLAVRPGEVKLDDGSRSPWWFHGNVRAAIKGVDYDTHPEIQANTGHLPDGSSVQKHSAGPLYPCVLVMRDGLLGQKYDVGVISPRNQEPLWFSTHDAAVAVAELIKKDLS